MAWLGYLYYTTGYLPVRIAALQSDPKVDTSHITKKQVDTYTVPPEHPRYISIPSLSIGNTRVYPVGVKPNGELATPENIHDAAWYEKSALPGSGYGAVLIDAHNGGYANNGVFSALHTITIGATVVVERGDGKKFTYKVIESKTISLTETNNGGMARMMQSIEPDKEGLSLITCAGNWVPKLQQYDQRVMVRAVIESAEITF